MTLTEPIRALKAALPLINNVVPAVVPPPVSPIEFFLHLGGPPSQDRSWHWEPCPTMFLDSKGPKSKRAHAHSRVGLRETDLP